MFKAFKKNSKSQVQSSKQAPTSKYQLKKLELGLEILKLFGALSLNFELGFKL